MKKVISCILTFILILNVLPVIAFGDSTDLDIIVEDFADMSDLSLSGLTEVSTGQQNGSTSFTAKTATFSAITKNISPAINIVDYAKMHLAVTFGFYIENASLLQPSQFELTSSGKCDVNEIHWNFDKNTVKNGWNILTFRFDNADIVGGDINLSNINYFRTFLNLTAQTKVGFSTAKIILSGENTIENFIIFDGENTTGCRTTANSVGIISSLDTENFTEGKSSIEYYTTTTNQFIFFYDYITDNGKAFTLGDFEYVEGDFYSHREMIANVVFSFVANTVNVSGTDYKFSSPVFFPKNTWTHFKIPLNQFVDDTTNGAPTRNAINRISLRLTNLTDRDGNPLENGRACVDNFRLTKNSMGENNTFTTMSDTMWEDYFENTPPEFKQLLGDVSIDNKINSNDALLALKHSVELIELDEDMQKLADVNANDTVTVVDALIILQYSVKLVANLPLVDRSEDKDMTKFTSPTVIKNSYNREGLFVAEVAATADKFGADPTGVKDSTAAIQSAIDYCADELNGGVVYLPAGKYRVEGTITVKTGTTLIGDYVDPDDVNNSDYGTMFMVYTDKRFADGKAVISMQTGTAINGITFYYPEQTVDNPIDYYYTISTEGAPSPRTITNITLLNSYCGIESSKNHAIGMSTITNIKGTALKTGMSVYNTADICLYTDITFSPHYWADMDEEFSPPAQTAIRTLLKSNESIGIYVRDLDRDNFRNIYIDGYYYGFYGDTPQRGHWSGSVFNARILNASYGVYTKTVNLAYGVNFAESRIDGSVKAVVNEGEGYLTFNNCTLMGSKSGKTTLLCNPLDKYEEEQPKISLPNKNDLFNFGDYNPDMTGQTDVTVLLQKALDDAEQNGGGIVYIPGGRYRIDGSVSVAEGIMLVGSSYYSTNTPKKGTTFYIYGKSDSPIVVTGENSGVCGVTFAYPENGFTNDDANTNAINEYPYAIVCKAKATYVKNVCMAAVSKAVKFENADNFILDRFMGNVWHNAIKVENSDNGIIYGIHVNATYRIAFFNNDPDVCSNWHTDVIYVIDNVVRKNLTLLDITDSQNIQLIEDFHYGAKNYAKLDNSTVFALNSEAARLIDSGYFFNGSNSSKIIGINFICYPTGEDVLFVLDKTSEAELYSLDRAHIEAYNFIKKFNKD